VPVFLLHQSPMTNNKETILLSQKEALAAIRLDFMQYGPQFALYQELCPIISENRIIVVREGRNDCVLITKGRKSKKRRMNQDDLGNYLYNTLQANSCSLSVLAEICSRVFQTPARIGKNAETGCSGIQIETDMTRFLCRQCGDCCRNLIYHNDCTEEDFRRWQVLERIDILKRVKVVQHDDGPATYRIWMNPDTGRLLRECPWLKKSKTKNRFECSIQEIKPEFCRVYPLTRKHAAMTGCKGKFK